MVLVFYQLLKIAELLFLRCFIIVIALENVILKTLGLDEIDILNIQMYIKKKMF